MRQHDDSREAVEQTVRDIKPKTRRHSGSEEKIRIVLQGLRGEELHRQYLRMVERMLFPHLQ